jgi:hypothetical protein
MEAKQGYKFTSHLPVSTLNMRLHVLKMLSTHLISHFPNKFLFDMSLPSNFKSLLKHVGFVMDDNEKLVFSGGNGNCAGRHCSKYLGSNKTRCGFGSDE